MPDEIPVTHYVYEIAKTMKETMERFENKLDINTLKTEQILVQATKTNGRVNGLEGFSEETKKAIIGLLKSSEVSRDEINLIKEKHTSDVRSVKWVIVISAFFLGTIGTLGYALVQKNIEDTNAKQQAQIEIDTAQKVVSTIQQEYNLQVTK